jgi:putative intracellular protease/amidase
MNQGDTYELLLNTYAGYDIFFVSGGNAGTNRLRSRSAEGLRKDRTTLPEHIGKGRINQR